VIYLPRDWGIVPGDRIPVGTKVGFIDSIETFGFINSSCDNPVSWRFELLNASLDPGTTVSLRDTDTDSNSEGFGMRDFAEDKGKNGLLDGIDHYPDYLDAALRGERPLVRLAGVGVLAGQPVLRQLIIFPPDTRLNFPDPQVTQSIADAGVLGYPMMIVSQDFRNLDVAPREPSPITDYCSPSNLTFSLSPIENGPPILVNPQAAAYGFTLLSISKRDADGDGYENSLDTCPLEPNAGSPRLLNDGDFDGDGLDAACDPNDDPSNDGNNSDQDADAYLNRQDNCPMTPNGIGGYGLIPNASAEPSTQLDQDFDDIGDVCDPNPQSPYGEALVSVKTANVVVGDASGSGGAPNVMACPQCYRPGEKVSRTSEGDDRGQLAVVAGLIALGAGAGAVVIGGSSLYLLRRRRS